MKKFIASILSVSCFFICATAQNPVVSVEKSAPSVNVKYVNQTDSTTQVYCVYTFPGDTAYSLVNVSRRIHVCSDDMEYKLKGTKNIPVADESVLEYALLEEPGQKYNFILEFEPFPTDAPFDIIENEKSESALNFTGIKVDVSVKKKVDATRFTSSTPVVLCGRYYEEGHCFEYYYRDDVFVCSRSTYSNSHFSIYLTVSNNSDHGILFNTGKIKAVGYKQNGKKFTEVDLPYLSKNSYVEEVVMDDYSTARSEVSSNALSNVRSAVSYASIGTPFNSLEHTGLKIIEGIIGDVEAAKMRPYLKDLAASRAQRTKDYLQSESIAPGKTIDGFFRIERKKKVNNYVITIPMDGYEFVFEGYIEK